MLKTTLALSLLIAGNVWAAPKVEIGLLLDSSGSMSGLINQTRNKLWKLMNELDYARKDDQKPIVKIGLYSYGNGVHPDAVQEIVKLSSLTTDHDSLSEKFFALSASGGSELAGTVVHQALNHLTFSTDGDFKALFLAGNETLKQGEITIEKSADEAVQNDVLLNTIYAAGLRINRPFPRRPVPRFPRGPVPAPTPLPAPIPSGPLEDPILQEWKMAAELGKGSFHHINSNAQEVYIEAPQDDKIIELNNKLNLTYVPYGKSGIEAYKRMIKVDGSSSTAGRGVLIGRGRYKSGGHYDVTNWDLVDAVKNNKVKIEDLKESELPKELKGLNVSEIKAYLSQKENERTQIKADIVELYKEREKYVAKKKKEMTEENGDIDNIEQAMVKSLKKQLEAKGFVFIDKD